MEMNILDLHKTYIHLWPDRIRIDDGYASGSGFMFPTLNQVHHRIEDGIDHKTDHWGNVFTWSMSQACHGLAKELFEQGTSEMLISEVPLEAIDRWVVSNLSGEGWEEERALYVALGSNHSLQADRPDGRRPELKRYAPGPALPRIRQRRIVRLYADHHRIAPIHQALAGLLV